MKKNLIAAFFCLFKCIPLTAMVTCSPKPVASATPLNSVLNIAPKEYYEYVGDRLRLSTCTGVIWIGDNKLMSVGVYNASLDTYQFDPVKPSLEAREHTELSSLQTARLGQLENIAISKDGTLAAISNNGEAAIHLYKISGSKLVHFAQLPKKGWWIHGVRFSIDNEFLGYTIFGNPGQIRLFRILKAENGTISFMPTQVMDTESFPLQPKALDFSIDGRYVAVCYAINNSRNKNSLSGAIFVYRFHRELGMIDPTPVSCIGTSAGISVPEDLCFYPDGSCIIVTNHGNDTITVYPFDLDSGKIGEGKALLQNPEAQLSFPHGLCLSPDGKYLAVTNYGDDTVKIYTISPL